MLVDIPVSEVMTPDVVTVNEDVAAVRAAELMRKGDVGSVVVVRDGEPVGLVTDKLLLDLLIQDGDLSVPVGEFMVSPLVTVGADESVEAAAERLQENEIKRLPVTRDGALTGIVTTTDLAYFLPTAGMKRARDRADWDYAETGLEDSEIDVGDAVSFSKSLDDSDVRRFAEACGDLNELHVNEEYAANTRFGGRIVHGVLVLGVISAALSRLPGLVIYLSQNASFQAAVGVGDNVEAECTVTESLGNHRYLLSTDVYSGEERVVQGEATVMVDPEPSPQE